MPDGKEDDKRMLSQALPVSEAKAKFSELVKLAGLGLEVVSANKHGHAPPVSLVKTEILAAALAAMEIPSIETRDDELGVTTIALEDLPVYGEGTTRAVAIESLVDAVLDYTAVYKEKIELFSKIDTPVQQGRMLKLMRCGGDRDAIKRAIGV
ncbi:MAG: hypothetical protein ACM3X6_01245 [Patescibacteria group bacterium]